MVSVIPSSPPSNHLYPLLGGPTKIFPSDYTSCSLMWKSQASRDFRKCPRDWAHNTLSFLWPASLPCFQPSLEVTLIGIPRLPNNLFPVHLLPAKARKTIVSLVCLEVLRPNNSWLSPRGFVHPPRKSSLWEPELTSQISWEGMQTFSVTCDQHNTQVLHINT